MFPLVQGLAEINLVRFGGQLDNKDHRGIISNVFLMGAPVTVQPSRWEAIRPLVAGRLVNCYSRTDWLLPVIHRAATGKIKSSAGNTVGALRTNYRPFVNN